jgi:hypothetical protein
MPPFLHIVACVYLIACFVCAIILVIDEIAHPQKMWIMNLVWPANALYWGPFALWIYLRWGRSVHEHKNTHEKTPFWVMSALATAHCGAGCTLGDIVAETFIFFAGFNLFGTIAHHDLFTAYVLDYLCAYLLGIVFQYFTIAPMRHLTLGKGLIAAIKADTLSLTAFEIGLFVWMALPPLFFFGHPLSKATPEFWFMMQIGMLLGFLTSYPINYWLLKSGLKEKM